MRVSHQTFLEHLLKISKIELNELQINHRITIAEFNVKKDLLQRQIDSIEMQLEKSENS